MLKSMSLNAPFDKLSATIASFYDQKIKLYNGMIAMATALAQVWQLVRSEPLKHHPREHREPAPPA
jgi:hypothetical protein